MEDKNQRHSPERTALLANVAEMYYMKDMKQAEIARCTGVTRSMISRMLTEARQSGIVEIKINHPLLFEENLQLELIKRFGLNNAYVVVNNVKNNSQLQRRVGYAAATILKGYLRSGMTIGIPWGTTVSTVIDELIVDEPANIKVVQLVGAVGAHNYEYDGHGAVQRLVQKLGGEGYYMNAPFVLDTPEMVQALLHNKSLQETLTLAKQCDLALLGVGSLELESSSFYQAGYITAEEVQSLTTLGAVGGVCGLHYDIQGNPRGLDFQSRLITIGREDLLNTPIRIGVSCGPGKVEANIGAVRAGYVNVLVTDSITARKMLWLTEKK